MTHFDQGTLVASTAFPVSKTKRGMKSVKRTKQPPTLVLRRCPLSQTHRSPGRPSLHPPRGPLSAQRPPRPAREAGDRMPHLPPGLPESPRPPPQTPSASCPLLPSSYSSPHSPVQGPLLGLQVRRSEREDPRPRPLRALAEPSSPGDPSTATRSPPGRPPGS